ncbi:hypothetical protein D9M71_715210 [compost metagenome]
MTQQGKLGSGQSDVLQGIVIDSGDAARGATQLGAQAFGSQHDACIYPHHALVKQTNLIGIPRC